jgi:predicted permease
VVALGAATTASVTSAGRAVLVPLAAAAASSVLAMGAVATRQWRFVPTRRRVDAVFVVAAACAVLLGYPPAASDGEEWSVALVAVALVVGLLTAWPAARRLAATRPSATVVGEPGVPAP